MIPHSRSTPDMELERARKVLKHNDNETESTRLLRILLCVDDFCFLLKEKEEADMRKKHEEEMKRKQEEFLKQQQEELRKQQLEIQREKEEMERKREALERETAIQLQV